MRGIMTGCPFPSHRGAVTPAQRGEKREEKEENLEKGGGEGGEVRTGEGAEKRLNGFKV